MVNTYTEILSWSAKRPAWQRDALRRLLDGRLKAEDYDALHEQCVGAHVEGIQARSVFLNTTHLPQQGDARAAVTLTRLHSLENVAALADGQALSFAPAGLNIVYGDNGSGKSSYARVLKQLCRARGARAAVAPNVFTDGQGCCPAAQIDFSAGGISASVRWVGDGTSPSPPDLSRVWIFDSEAARAYVSEKNELPFLPAGLDLLQGLAKACDVLRKRLEAERESQVQISRTLPAVPPGTEVDRLLKNLTAVAAAEEVERLASLTPHETARLAQLSGDLARLEAEDPRKEAARLRSRADRYRALAGRAASIAASLSDQALAALASLREDLTAKQNAAVVASSSGFAAEPLPGVGSPVWRELWLAATAYAERAAYVGESFPPAGEGSRCVLCHQLLSAEARDRLRRFEEFVRGEVTNRAEAARQVFDDAAAKVSNLDTGLEQNLLDEIRTDDESLANAVSAFFRTASERRAIGLGGADPITAPALPCCPAVALEERVSGLLARATEIEAQADDQVRQGLRTELNELRARQVLALNKQQVLAAIAAHRHLRALAAALADTDSKPVTKLATDLSKQAISESLASAFARELENLGITSPLEIRAAGSKGQLLHQVGLQGAKRKAGAGDILSEGEHRAVALAAFFAEMSLHPAKSAVVFDDPTSSFDHMRRRKVAKRIAKEAADRQVVVFTHDLVFLDRLRSEAKEASVSVHYLLVERRGPECGFAEPDLPWISKTVTQRLGALKNRSQGLPKLLRDQGRTAYEAEAKDIYGKLRESWESAVEEVLLYKAVRRFSERVETTRLAKVSLLDTDLKRIERAMTKTSRWMTGHDQPLAANEPVPDPDELARDIQDLEDWTKEVGERREKAEKEKKRRREAGPTISPTV
jgi:energy-coupling factor transporter ATP-binding protein EcfA2